MGFRRCLCAIRWRRSRRGLKIRLRERRYRLEVLAIEPTTASAPDRARAVSPRRRRASAWPCFTAALRVRAYAPQPQLLLRCSPARLRSPASARPGQPALLRLGPPARWQRWPVFPATTKRHRHALRAPAPARWQRAGALSGVGAYGVCYRRCRWRHGGHGARSGPRRRRFRCWLRPRLAPPPRPRCAPAPKRKRPARSPRDHQPGRRRLHRPSVRSAAAADLNATIEGLRRRNRDGSGIAGDGLQRCGDGRQAHERFVVDAEGGEHAESGSSTPRSRQTSPRSSGGYSETFDLAERPARSAAARITRGERSSRGHIALAPAAAQRPTHHRTAGDSARRIQHLRHLRESLKNQHEKFAGRRRC